MRVLGVTLARGGSKGIYKKNIKPCAGKPLIAWTILEARKSRRLTDYVVSTDSGEIADAAMQFGATVINRPSVLAGDSTPSLVALQHAVAEMEKGTAHYDIVVLLPATNPLKTVDDIDCAVDRLTAIDGAKSVIGVGPSQPVERIKKLDMFGQILDTYEEPLDGQRQYLPYYYIRNGSIYAVKRDVVMLEHSLFGHPGSYAWKMPKERSVNIDDQFDFAVAEMLLERRNK